MGSKIFWMPKITHPQNFWYLAKRLNSNKNSYLTDTGENVQKWTRLISTRRWVVLVARMSRKKRRKYSRPLLDVFACGQVSSPRLYRLRSSMLFIRTPNNFQFRLSLLIKKNVVHSYALIIRYDKITIGGTTFDAFFVSWEPDVGTFYFRVDQKSPDQN